MQIIPYEEKHIAAVKKFNERMLAAQTELFFTFPEVAKSSELAKDENSRIYQQYYLAVEEDNVHGGYILKQQPSQKLNNEITIGNYQLPLSEGIINPRFAMVGVQIYLDVIRKQKYLYSLGMGNQNRPLPQFLKKMGWSVGDVPFFFKILKPTNVIKYMPAIRNHYRLKPFMFILDQLKIFSLMINIYNLLQKIRSNKTDAKIVVTHEPEFSNWADEIWQQSKNDFQWICERSSEILNTLYPSKSNRYIRLHLKKENKSIGWALVLATQMKEHKQFPNMKVGTIADGLCLKGYENDLIVACERFLQKQSVDLIISNQSHHRWTQAFKSNGYLNAPTNYIIAFSPEMMKGLTDFSQCHINRGDGDGPINL